MYKHEKVSIILSFVVYIKYLPILKLISNDSRKFRTQQFVDLPAKLIL